MTFRSDMDDLAAIRTLGTRLAALGAIPAAAPTRCPGDLVGGLERLRSLLSGEPVTPTEDQTAAYARRYRGQPISRLSGWADGQPYCGGCKAFLPSPGALCVQCGFMAGAGYVGVPAKTSHLERWR